MERLILRKLIVISQTERHSLEVPFKEGLNIIYGDNKTGKSSLIKSIFITLGCDCDKVEKSWTNLISTYLLYFKYGDKMLCVMREKDEFQIFRVYENERYKCLYATGKPSFNEYSNFLDKLLGVSMPCVGKNGKEYNITPPLLFRFQYIDQDNGWSKIADAFTNACYIKDWKSNTNKYISGYLTEDFFELQKEKELSILKKDDLNKKYKNNSDFLLQIKEAIPETDFNFTQDNTDVELSQLIEYRNKKKIALHEERGIIEQIEKKIFEYEQHLSFLNYNIAEIQKDVDSALNSNDTKVCPVCGAQYQNTLEHQMDISANYAMTEELTLVIVKELKNAQNNLDDNKQQFSILNREIIQLNQQIKNSEKYLLFETASEAKGKVELYSESEEKLNELLMDVEDEVSKISKIETQQNEKKSRKRQKEINNVIESYCFQVAEKINVPKPVVKLKDFVQVNGSTGSDLPRIIFMYQTGLYLYNLNRADSPFNFIVVDTPNQQGQDANNLNRIYESLELFTTTEGQFILGTERETGYEEKAATILHLTDNHRCLKALDYEKHSKLIESLKKIGNSFIRENFTKSEQEVTE